ncbi:hypothetical protein [Bradyrhizobium japonicum]|uniref:hypothetical protein n=1 Tax=Bradyrhizobium japonicum TaxID=375 RepID=UPI00209DB3F0|nr:hypothetical protein [Bradyrhizobium japonicum]MCP1783877.1 hypothetical protein [Bradyrhizobium japonicum]MCP1963835.1 hypothetical protein [Bradyrhizobium japonicum]
MSFVALKFGFTAFAWTARAASTPSDRDRLHLIKLLDEIVKRRCPSVCSSPFREVACRSEVGSKLRGSIHPELLAGNPLSFAEQTYLHDLLLDADCELVTTLQVLPD